MEHERTTPGGGMNVNVDLNRQPTDNPIFHFGGAPNVRYAYEDGGSNDHIPNNSNPYGQAAEEASAPPSYNEAVGATPVAAACVPGEAVPVEAHYMRPSEEFRYEAEMTGVNRGLPPGYEKRY
jgi:hypothetical protein